MEIQLLNILNSRVQQRKTTTKRQQQNSGLLGLKSFTSFPFNVKNTKLAPLQRDTISFTAAKRAYTVIPSPKELSTVEEISQNANDAKNNLSSVLNTYLKDLIASDDNSNKDAPIKEIQTRIKHPDSIQEKIGSIQQNEEAEIEKYKKIIEAAKTAETEAETEAEKAVAVTAAEQAKLSLIELEKKRLKVTDKNSIKNEIQDIVGARIVLRKADEKYTEQILTALLKAAEDGALKITKVEHYIAPKVHHDLRVDTAGKDQYFDDESLKNFINNLNAIRANINSDSRIKFTTDRKKSGYMALHLNVDLRTCTTNPDKQGYYGEIQIIGDDVAKLKEIEDICYKLKTAKSKGIVVSSPVNHALVTYFNKYYTNNISNKFQLYTRRAYYLQRYKKPTPIGAKEDCNLPTIAECSVKHDLDSLPKQLDFNVLKAYKEICDNTTNTLNSIEKFPELYIPEKRTKNK